jgi:uncharacterized damage-inducible protein DinB
VVELDEQGRPEPPPSGDEAGTLIGFLDFQRATLEWKTRGLDADGLRSRVGASTMTLGGILKHLALVEQSWFGHRLSGRDETEPWAAIDWDADPDWEWRTAADDDPEDLRTGWRQAVEQSRADVEAALSRGGLDQPAVLGWSAEVRPSLRWILVHMIEEYARHNGHADLLREAVDGETGE